MHKRLPDHLRVLLVEVCAKYRCNLPPEGAERLEPAEREMLVDALLMELSVNGLGPDDEPNGRGLDIETLIDFIGSLSG